METVEVVAVCPNNLGESKIVLFRLKNHEPIGSTDGNHFQFVTEALKWWGFDDAVKGELVTFDKFDNPEFVEQAIDFCDMMFVYNMKSDESIRVLKEAKQRMSG